ncbi:uncharacterized protein LOC136038616 [Artemia franciscana]
MFHQPGPHGYPSGVPSYPPQYGQQVYPPMTQSAFPQEFYTGAPRPYYEGITDGRMPYAIPQSSYVPGMMYPPQDMQPPGAAAATVLSHASKDPRKKALETGVSLKKRHESRSPKRGEGKSKDSKKSPVRIERKRSRSRSPVRSSKRSSPVSRTSRTSRASSPSHRRNMTSVASLSRDEDSPKEEEPPAVVTTLKKGNLLDTKITIVNDVRRSRSSDQVWTGTWMQLNSLLEHRPLSGEVIWATKYGGATIDIYKDMEELRRITVEIRRRIYGKTSPGPVKRELVPHEFVFTRRVGEGSKPIFDRPALALNEERSVVVKAQPEDKFDRKKETTGRDKREEEPRRPLHRTGEKTKPRDDYRERDRDTSRVKEKHPSSVSQPRRGDISPDRVSRPRARVDSRISPERSRAKQLDPLNQPIPSGRLSRSNERLPRSGERVHRSNERIPRSSERRQRSGERHPHSTERQERLTERRHRDNLELLRERDEAERIHGRPDLGRVYEKSDFEHNRRDAYVDRGHGRVETDYVRERPDEGRIHDREYFDRSRDQVFDHMVQRSDVYPRDDVIVRGRGYNDNIPRYEEERHPDIRLERYGERSDLPGNDWQETSDLRFTLERRRSLERRPDIRRSRSPVMRPYEEPMNYPVDQYSTPYMSPLMTMEPSFDRPFDHPFSERRDLIPSRGNDFLDDQVYPDRLETSQRSRPGPSAKFPKTWPPKGAKSLPKRGSFRGKFRGKATNRSGATRNRI